MIKHAQIDINKTPEDGLKVHCPACGAVASRQYMPIESLSDTLARRCSKDKWALYTSCSACDYLLSFCPKSGAVIEACTF